MYTLHLHPKIGPNSSGDDYLCIAGIELYGLLRETIEGNNSRLSTPRGVVNNPGVVSVQQSGGGLGVVNSFMEGSTNLNGLNFNNDLMLKEYSDNDYPLPPL